MNCYREIVLCANQATGEKALCYAPGFTKLEAGEVVEVATEDGVAMAEVIASETFNTERGEFLFLMKACGVNKPMHKVLSRCRMVEVEY